MQCNVKITDYFLQISRKCPSNLYILPILSFSIIYNLPKFFELEVTSKVVSSNGTEEESNDTVDIPLPKMYDESDSEDIIGSVMVSYLYV